MRIESMSTNLFAQLTAGNRVGGGKALAELAQTQLVRLELGAQEKPAELQNVEKSEFDPFERLRAMYEENEDAYRTALEWMNTGYRTLQDRIAGLKEQLLDETLTAGERERVEELLEQARLELGEYESHMEHWKNVLNQSFDESAEELSALFAILKSKMAEDAGQVVSLKELLDMRAEARIGLLEATRDNLETRNRLREQQILPEGEDSVTRQADRLEELELQQAAAKRGEASRKEELAGAQFTMVLAKVEHFVREAVAKLNAARSMPEAEMDIRA